LISDVIHCSASSELASDPGQHAPTLSDKPSLLETPRSASNFPTYKANFPVLKTDYEVLAFAQAAEKAGSRCGRLLSTLHLVQRPQQSAHVWHLAIALNELRVNQWKKGYWASTGHAGLHCQLSCWCCQYVRCMQALWANPNTWFLTFKY
jgi:hypothetical protein